MSQPFDKEQLSFLRQLITNRNKEVRHEVSDHLDNTLPVRKLKAHTGPASLETDADGNTAWVESSSGLYVPKSIGDAKGDLIGFSADNTPVKIAAAAGDGYGLISDSSQSGGVAWSKNRHFASCYRVGNQVVSGAAWNVVDITNTNNAQGDVTPDLAGNIITVNRTGYWRVWGAVHFLTPGVATTNSCKVGHNSGSTLTAGSMYAPGGMALGYTTVVAPPRIHLLTSGDWVALYAHWVVSSSGAGGSHTIGPGWSTDTFIAVEWVGEA